MTRFALVSVFLTLTLSAWAAGEVVTLAPPGERIAYGKTAEYVVKATDGYKSARPKITNPGVYNSCLVNGQRVNSYLAKITANVAMLRNCTICPRTESLH